MLDSKPNTIAEKTWFQEAPALPMNAGGLPFYFREFFYRREESDQGLRARKYAVLMVGLVSVFFNWLPVQEYLVGVATLEECAMGLAGFWVVAVVGLCWLSQYLKLGQSVLLVAPYAFVSPWALYTAAYAAPFSALLAGFSGILVAAGLALVFRSRHQYRSVKTTVQFTPEQLANLKKNAEELGDKTKIPGPIAALLCTDEASVSPG